MQVKSCWGQPHLAATHPTGSCICIYCQNVLWAPLGILLLPPCIYVLVQARAAVPVPKYLTMQGCIFLCALVHQALALAGAQLYVSCVCSPIAIVY